MKKIFILTLIIMSFNEIYGQESNTRLLKIKPFLSSGINLLRNDDIKDDYQTSSTLFYGGGIIFDFKENLKFSPKLEYQYSRFMVDSSQFMPRSGMFEIHQIGLGLYFPITKNNDYKILMNAGGLGGLFLNNLVSYNYTYYGAVIGVSLEKEIFKRNDIIFELNYNYRKIREINMQRDLDALEFKVIITI